MTICCVADDCLTVSREQRALSIDQRIVVQTTATNVDVWDVICAVWNALDQTLTVEQIVSQVTQRTCVIDDGLTVWNIDCHTINSVELVSVQAADAIVCVWLVNGAVADTLDSTSSI